MSWFSSVQFSHSVVSDSLRPPGLQHARLPCPSPTPRVHSNSCPLSRWCHPTISSSVVPFFSRLQSFPASGSSQESALHIEWTKYWSFIFSINPSNEYWGLISSRMDWLDLLAVQGTLKSLLQHHSSKASIFPCSAGSVFKIYFKYLIYRYTKKKKNSFTWNSSELSPVFYLLKLTSLSQSPFLEQNSVSGFHTVLSQERSWNRPSWIFSFIRLNLLDIDLDHHWICYNYSSNLLSPKCRGAINTSLIKVPSPYPSPPTPPPTWTYCVPWILQCAKDGQGWGVQRHGSQGTPDTSGQF